MNNIIKSHKYLLKRFPLKGVTAILVVYVVSIALSISGGLNNSYDDSLYPFGFVLISSLIPCAIEVNIYKSKIAMYGIMMYSPRDILLGKLVAYLTVIIPIGLLPMTVLNLIINHSIDNILFQAEIWILCLRATAVVVFLSPVFKRILYIYFFTAYLLFLTTKVPILLRPLSVVFEMMMAEYISPSNVKETFPIILISTVIIVGGCYTVGWTVLKKKHSLE